MQKRSRINEKTMLERWRRRNTICGGRSHAPVSTGQIQGLYFVSQNRKTKVKNAINNYIKNEHPKTLTFMPQRCQKGNRIDATTHQKSMPKLVTKTIMEIIKDHVSLNFKIIQAHSKNMCFWRYQKTSKMRPTSSPQSKHISMRKRCSKKWCQNNRKLCEHGIQKVASI